MNQNMQNTIGRIEQSIHASEWLTPSNLSQEREKFLRDENVNPQFIYPEIDKKFLKENLDFLESIDISKADTLNSWILKRKIEFLKLELSLFLHKDTDAFSEITCKLYQCSFSTKFLERAKKDASSSLPFTCTEHKTPPQIVEGIKEYLASYDIFDWNVDLSEATDFYFRVEAHKKQIYLGKKFNWDFCNFDGMLAHEIDGHVIRAINASKQSNVLLQKPLPFYIKTEEGLASFLGDYCSSTAQINRKHHALKYLAGHFAQTHSFKEVFHFLVEAGFTKDLAFQRAFRLKRGISDTSRPGVYAREAMYYEGMLEIKNYLDTNGSVEKLYSAKVGLQDLEYIETSKDVIIPKRMKEYLDRRALSD